MKKKLLLIVSLFIFNTSFAQDVKVEYLGFDGIGARYKRYLTWGLGYHHELGEKITIGLNYRSYYGFLPNHDPEFDNTATFNLEVVNQNGVIETAKVDFFRDISWYGFYYSSRFFFSSIRDDGYFIEESIGYYHMRSILDVQSFVYGYGPEAADMSILGKLEQVDILYPIALHFGARGYLDTGALNDLTYDITIGAQYVLGDPNPVLKNIVFRENGESIRFSKLSFDLAISFGMMF
ncbi:MAG: hypothetical protein ACO1G9_15295 [Bacteroidota bacterium]